MKSASLQYATALADIVLEQGAAEPTRQELEDFRTAYEESAELRNFLGSPAIPREAKHGVIEKLVTRLGGSENHSEFSVCDVGQSADPSFTRNCGDF